MLEDLVIVAAAFGFGVGSAILPIFLNAEAYVIASSAFMDDSMLVVAIVSLVVGTVAGKAIVFEAARQGKRKLDERGAPKPPRNRFTASIRRASDWMLGLLDRKWAGGLTVLASSLVGVPPLAVVSILAGLSKQPLWLFLTLVGVGRLVQFLAIAFVFHAVF